MALETDRKPTDRLKVERGKDQQFYLSRVAGNNKVRWTSEGYTREYDAWRASWDDASDIAEGFAPESTRPEVYDEPDTTSADQPGPLFDGDPDDQTQPGEPGELNDLNLGKTDADIPPDEVDAAARRDEKIAAAEVEADDVVYERPVLEEGGNPYAPHAAVELPETD